MAAIHLMVGFLGFGKTSVAKKLEKEFHAVRFTHDEIMLARHGRNPDDFAHKYKLVDEFIREQTVETIKQGKDVILDYGFWAHDIRKEYYDWAKTLTDDVIFHVLYCDLALAKKRVLERTETDENALLIDENAFQTLYDKYEPWSNEDKFPAVFHFAANNQIFTSEFNPAVTRTHFGVYGVIIQNNKMLLIKKARGPYTGLYDLPGGGQERGESFHETLAREIKEETGCDILCSGEGNFYSIIFSDFTKESGETGILQHNAMLYDVETEGELLSTGDGLDSNGAVWVKIKELSKENATPLVLAAMKRQKA